MGPLSRQQVLQHMFRYAFACYRVLMVVPSYFCNDKVETYIAVGIKFRTWGKLYKQNKYKCRTMLHLQHQTYIQLTCYECILEDKFVGDSGRSLYWPGWICDKSCKLSKSITHQIPQLLAI